MNVKLCVPLTPSGPEQLRMQLAAAAASTADVVEWRIDYWKGVGETDSWRPALIQLREALADKALLLTFRSQGQGGCLPREEAAYEALLTVALQTARLEYLDVEADVSAPVFARLCNAARERGTAVIASFHDFEQTPMLEGLLERLRSLSETGADIVKAAYMPKSAADVARLLEATAIMRTALPQTQRIITMSMGELGRVSRIAAGVFGSCMSFAAVCECSAPGQLPLETMRKIQEVLS